MCDYETIESVNDDLYHNLRELVRMPFFKYFQVSKFISPYLVRIARSHILCIGSQVDLYRECPFWVDNGSCMSRDCGVTTVDEVTAHFVYLALKTSLIRAIRARYQKDGEQLH